MPRTRVPMTGSSLARLTVTKKAHQTPHGAPIPQTLAARRLHQQFTNPATRSNLRFTTPVLPVPLSRVMREESSRYHLRNQQLYAQHQAQAQHQAENQAENHTPPEKHIADLRKAELREANSGNKAVATQADIKALRRESETYRVEIEEEIDAVIEAEVEARMKAEQALWKAIEANNRAFETDLKALETYLTALIKAQQGKEHSEMKRMSDDAVRATIISVAVILLWKMVV